MIDKELLPIGSCIKILNCSKMIMIAGYLPYDNEKKIMYDYIGIYTPVGIRKNKQNIKINKDYVCFNNSDIEKIVFIGFSNEKSEFYCKYLSNIKVNLDNTNTDLSLETMKKVLKDSLPNVNDLKSEV